MDVEPTTSPSDMAKHSLMTVKAQALAYHDVKMMLSKITAKTGMSSSALKHLFRAARSEPATLPLSVLRRKAGSGWPPVVTDEIKKKMKRAHNTNPKLTARDLKKKLLCLSSVPVRTIQDVLCRVMGLRS